MSGTKKIVDNWVNANYERMLLLARARTTQCNRNYEGDIVISYCYEYLLNNLDKITEENIESIAFNFINMSAYWTRSTVNKIELQTTSPFQNSIEFKCYMLDIEDNDYLEKIELEKWLSLHKGIIELYKEQIRPDKVKSRLFNVMITRKKITVQEIAEHFNISKAGAWERVKEIKTEIRKLKKYNING